ncbi:MAG: hypothetical protein JF565_10725, partial [Propionibacteriales bacterium]|nr:hypothetical protein [Propionibacteriales bacterium]
MTSLTSSSRTIAHLVEPDQTREHEVGEDAHGPDDDHVHQCSELVVPGERTVHAVPRQQRKDCGEPHHQTDPDREAQEPLTGQAADLDRELSIGEGGTDRVGRGVRQHEPRCRLARVDAAGQCHRGEDVDTRDHALDEEHPAGLLEGVEPA